MVAKTVELPNVRRMFIPDDGYMMIDIDLERADAQVVAWEADDDELKDIFRSGADIHTENAAAVFHVPSSKVSYRQRQMAKAGVHGTNYGGSAKTIAAETGMTVAEADLFQSRWFEAHPKIKTNFHEKIAKCLLRDRTIHNAFGYNYTFFDRVTGTAQYGVDPKKFHEALAWVPQSTVAIATNLGLVSIDANLPSVHILLQVHDSLVLQAPIDECPEIFEKINECMKVIVPYDDPLIIPTSMGLSTLSWGDLFHLEQLPKLLSLANQPIPVITQALDIPPRIVEMVLENRVKYGATA